MSLAELCIKQNQRQMLLNRRSLAQMKAAPGEAASNDLNEPALSAADLARRNSNLLLANVMLRSCCRRRAGNSVDAR